jgi:hypothetical protein
MSLGSFRRRPIRRRWAVGIPTVVMIALVVLFVASSGAVTASPSNFESNDGNMTNDTGTSLVKSTDWNCFTNSDNFANSPPVNASSNCAVTSGAVHVSADAAGEITWVNGQKFDTQCPALQTGNVPNKDDFTDIAEYQEFASNGDLYFYGSSIRQTANGNASGDVEFNQTSGDGTTTAGCRTAGDRLIAYDFLNGGTSLDFHVLTWIDPTNLTAGGNSGKCFVKTDSPTPTGCWGANVITVSAADFDGQANQSPISAADNGLNNSALVEQQFAEFGVNLTHALGGSLPCFPQQVWESRSSGSSFTSNPEDIEFANLSTCGKITIIKHTSPRGLNQDFSYSTTGGLSPSTFTLNDNGNTTGDSAGNTQVYENVKVGTYTVSESATDPFGFAFDSVTCTGGTTSISGRTVTITLASNDDVTCTYVNTQQLGAIKVTKTSVKGTALAGATFSVTGPNSFSATLTSKADGTDCVDNLPFGTYSVTETAAPSGYDIDDTTTHNVSVATNTTCAGTPSQSLSFTDTPKADLTVTLTSEATGGTAGRITCVNSSSANIGNSPQPSANTFGDPVTVTANGLKPKSDGTAATYTCTILVDP